MAEEGECYEDVYQSEGCSTSASMPLQLFIWQGFGTRTEAHGFCIPGDLHQPLQHSHLAVGAPYLNLCVPLTFPQGRKL